MPLDHLLRGVLDRRWRIVLAALLLFALGATVVTGWPRSYLTQIVVAPAETTGLATSSLLSASALPLGSGLLDPRPVGNFAVYLDALRSPEAAAMLARDTGLLAYLTALRGARPLGPLRRALGLRIAADLDDAQNWLEARLAVTQGVASVTFTITLAHRDRAAALEALERLHALAEAKVRADLAGMARRRIAAIEARLAQENDLYLRTMLYDLLGQQQRAALVVQADEAVAARLVSAPMVEIRPSLPNRPLLLLLLAVVAPLASLFWAVCALLLGNPGYRGRMAQYGLAFGPDRQRTSAD
ncbi:hypothetical protein [Siccirubricoccus sp. G192]|uniref:hypothetical protein n=1 Tax=Siccirubricoccus sp. G192 TaxID=2849651 RepID=UPI001C2BFB70|nr:hypothetical protein [Siccirubricoccus sp. G192]MBV1795800.1 hypothetical protein [Siccirubricoccus sp. G192]